VGEIAIGLVHEEHRARPLREFHQRVELFEREHRARRIVRAGDGDHLRRPRSDPRRERVDVEPPPVVEREVDDVDIGPYRARSFQVGRVVRTRDDDVIAWFEL
jgi:hypothetical protein